MKKILGVALLFAGMIFSFATSAQDEKDQKLIDDSNEAKEEFIRTDGLMKNLFIDAIPTIDPCS